jgi:cytoskeletal protein CcmA (bactofilin family)
MFSKGKAKPTQKASSAAPSIISSDLRITGNLESKGEVQMDGTLEGDIKCARLSVGDSGHIMGAVVVENALIRGRVDGQIKANKITLTRSARVVGDIVHETLTIEPGAHLEGHCRRADTSVFKGDGKVDSKINLKGDGKADSKINLVIGESEKKQSVS